MGDLQFFANRLTGDLSSDTIASIYAPRVNKGRHQKLTNVTVEKIQNTATRVRLFIERNGVKHYKAEQLAPAAGVLYEHPYPLHLHENDRLGADYTGHTSGDDVVLTYEGFERDNPFHDFEWEKPM